MLPWRPIKGRAPGGHGESGAFFGEVTVLVASVLAIVPVWIPIFPPMTDLPQHASQVALLRELLLHPDSSYAATFRVNWFTPYWFGYLLTFCLTSLVGIVAACKVVVSLALAAVPIATALVMRETDTDQRLAILTIPALYGFAYQWGFLNFLAASPVGLVFLWLTLRHANRPTRGSATAVGVGIIALFFCHALICVFFGAIAGAILLLNGGTASERLRRLAPLVPVVPIMMIWGLVAMSSANAQRPTIWDVNWLTTDEAYYSRMASWTTPGGAGWGRIAGLFPRLLGMRPGAWPTAIGLTLFLLPLAAGARFSRRVTHWVPFGVSLAVLLFMPRLLFGIDFAFQHFCMFVLPLYLIALERPVSHQWPVWIWPACGAVVALCVGFVSLAAFRYRAEAAGFEELLTHMQPGRRALSLVFEREGDQEAIAPAYINYPAWYAALKRGVVIPNFATTHVQVVVYREGHGSHDDVLSWAPGFFKWKEFNGGEYDYFVIRGEPDGGSWMSRLAPCGLTPVHHVDRWSLYENCRPGSVH